LLRGDSPRGVVLAGNIQHRHVIVHIDVTGRVIVAAAVPFVVLMSVQSLMCVSLALMCVSLALMCD
jgi:hypothetical protein